MCACVCVCVCMCVRVCTCAICISFIVNAVVATYSILNSVREYYHVLFTNLRVMIESEDVIEHYFGPHGYGYGFTSSNNV